jgi:hypothetical protein
MIWQKLNFNYCCQLHALPEDNGAADACRLPFFMYTKLKIPLWLNNNNKKNIYEITFKPLKPRLKKFEWQGNGVIYLFIKLYIYIYIYIMLLGLNNNNKKPIRKWQSSPWNQG